MFELSGRYRELEVDNLRKGNKQMDGEGMLVSCTLYLNGAARDILREKLINKF